MSRRQLPAILAAIAALLAVLVADRWSGLGFSPLLVILGVLVIFGLPAILWVLQSRRPSAPAGRRLPRVFWIGLVLTLIGGGAAFLGLAVATPQVSMGVSSIPAAPALHFTQLPASARAQIRTVFPGLAIRKVLTTSGFAYEVWLAHPGARDYQLELMWVKGGITVEYQGLNIAYTKRPHGAPLPLTNLLRNVSLRPRPDYGPVVFPGYVLLVSLPHDEAYVIDRYSGQVVAGMSW